MHVNIAGRIRTQPAQQTGTLGAALKEKLAQPEQREQVATTITLTPLPNSQRLAFTLKREGHPTKRGNFINAEIAAHVIGRMLDAEPTMTIIRKESA